MYPGYADAPSRQIRHLASLTDEASRDVARARAAYRAALLLDQAAIDRAAHACHETAQTHDALRTRLFTAQSKALTRRLGR